MAALPYPSKVDTREYATPHYLVNEAFDKYCHASALQDSFRRERDALLSALRRSIKSCERELIDVAEGLVNAERAEDRQDGDLILANVGAIPDGAKSADVEDFYDADGGGRRSIGLDPKLSVQENASRYYKRHQKARDAHERLTERQRTLEATLSELVQARETVSAAIDIHELQHIADGFGDDISAHIRPGGSGRSTVLPATAEEEAAF